MMRKQAKTNESSKQHALDQMQQLLKLENKQIILLRSNCMRKQVTKEGQTLRRCGRFQSAMKLELQRGLKLQPAKMNFKTAKHNMMKIASVVDDHRRTYSRHLLRRRAVRSDCAVGAADDEDEDVVRIEDTDDADAAETGVDAADFRGRA